MFFFIIAGIWYTFLSLFTFIKLFDASTTAAAAEVLPTYIAMATACFSIFSLLSKINDLKSTVDKLCDKVMKHDNDIKELQNAKKDE